MLAISTKCSSRTHQRLARTAAQFAPPLLRGPAFSPARLPASDRALMALAWRIAHAAARATAGALLGRTDADLDEVAATAALRALCRADLPHTAATVLEGHALERAASTAARNLARDLLCGRRGRRRPRSRRVDPLRCADTLGLSAVRPPIAVPSAEEILLGREHEREACRMLAAVGQLPRRQREAVVARPATRPLPPTARQALRSALATLRGIAAR